LQTIKCLFCRFCRKSVPKSFFHKRRDDDAAVAKAVPKAAAVGKAGVETAIAALASLPTIMKKRLRPPTARAMPAIPAAMSGIGTPKITTSDRIGN
jgi:hypothetical protein